MFAELAMADGNFHIREDVFEVISVFVDRFHSVMNDKDLTSSPQFTADRLLDNVITGMDNAGSHRKAVRRRSVDQAQIPDSHQRHVKGPGNWSC